MKALYTLLILSILLAVGCTDSGPEQKTDNFDRQSLLVSLADNYIVPGYEAYANSTSTMVEAKDAFLANPTSDLLENLKSTYTNALLQWQKVSPFEIGPAERNRMRTFTNIFPTYEGKINANINGIYNLDLPSNVPAQGFPALDYILYGMNEGDQPSLLSDERVRLYLSDLVDKLSLLSQDVSQEWKTTYRDQFIAEDGSSATASTDKIVNDLIFYYEKFLRAGKVGIPAGVFSTKPFSTKVEAPHQGNGKIYLEAAIENFKNILNGKVDGKDVVSLDSYLIELSYGDSSDLMDRINQQFSVVDKSIAGLNANLAEQVESDNIKMLEAYDELQKIVVLLKVDMLQQLNIQVDYVDADGD